MRKIALLISCVALLVSIIAVVDTKIYNITCAKIPHEFVIEEDILEEYFLTTNVNIEEIEEFDKGRLCVLVSIYDNGIVSRRRCLIKVKRVWLFSFKWELERVV